MPKMGKNRQVSFRLVILVSFFALCTTHSWAEVYRHVDSKGKVHYSDQPSPGAEPVEIKEVNTSKPVKPVKTTEATGEEAEEYSVTITSPEDQALFPNRLTPFVVSSRVTPKLEEGHRLRLLIDGKVHSISFDQFEVSRLSVGEHRLTVEIIDASDQVLSSSDSILIFTRNPGS